MSGLHKKPLWVKLLSLFLWINTVGMPLQVMVMFGHPPTEWFAIWAKLAPQNKLVMTLSPIAAVGVHRVTPWGWYATLAFLAISFFNNVILLQFPSVVPKVAILGSTTLIAGCGIWFFHPRNMLLFRDTRNHWWKSATRYLVQVPIEIETENGSSVKGETFNISRTGIFVETPLSDMRIGEIVKIYIQLKRRRIHGLASVVRRAKACSSYPQGFGLRFEALNLPDRIALQRALSGATA